MSKQRLDWTWLEHKELDQEHFQLRRPNSTVPEVQNRINRLFYSGIEVDPEEDTFTCEFPNSQRRRLFEALLQHFHLTNIPAWLAFEQARFQNIPAHCLKLQAIAPSTSLEVTLCSQGALATSFGMEFAWVLKDLTLRVDRHLLWTAINLAQARTLVQQLTNVKVRISDSKLLLNDLPAGDSFVLPLKPESELVWADAQEATERSQT